MRFNNRAGRVADKIFMNVKNDESSTSIVRGNVVVLRLDGSDDGLAVCLPSSKATGANSLVFGVAVGTIPAGQVSEVQVFGFCQYGTIRRATRAASTDSWASAASIAADAVLAVDTVNNCFSTSAASLGASAFLPMAVLAESLQSYASSASATSDSRTAYTSSAKMFLRIL